MWSKVQLVFNTVKHLKWTQVQYQMFYRIRGKLGIKPHLKPYDFRSRDQILVGEINSSLFNDLIQFKEKKIEFNFLNLPHQFDGDRIDWNFNEYGKLWTYNLNYFEFLLSDDLSYKEGISLIENYIDNWDHLKDGGEPFPISLRTINWIKFLSKNKVTNERIDERLYHQVQLLLNNLEYHLLANHLLENAFALIFAAYYFQDKQIYARAKALLLQELKEQVLADGAHYERSPMYHQIMLFRLLDVVSIVQNNSWKNQEMLPELKSKAQVMLSWLVNITLSSGDIPYVKDSAPNIAPKSSELLNYAESLGLSLKNNILLKESGYRWLQSGDARLLVDVGQVSPSYQPGHAHADELNFLLFDKGTPVIVDTGISTYEKNDQRQLERSTSSHNCLVVNGENSSQVWGGFRVGRRATVTLNKDNDSIISAAHSGYKPLGALVQRTFKVTSNGFIVESKVEGTSQLDASAHIHFHPEVSVVKISKNMYRLGRFEISIEPVAECFLESYMFATGYNQLVQAKRLTINRIMENKIKINYAN
ncbi:alginate lyase family protein [uncultured Roseivirga sp.]|uniref:alginate lyase family protein n=1 Tax=uncultured Roseivirga sp. TaxID=543088 RepID=UPI0030DD1BD5|tara:strand:- start:80742 stop:82343 length:1602 start_codon:yes stop_codon:yes gene_type:complete